MLNFRQRQGEAFSQTLCRFEETEKDVDVENYSVAEMRAHLRVAACIDSKLKEELLKLGQPENSTDPAEPLTSEAIWHATRNYEQRQKCLRSETDDVAVSSVSTNSNGCRSCGAETIWDAKRGRLHTHCLLHSHRAKDHSNLECSFQNCTNPRGNHSTVAHKRFGPGNNNYRSSPPPRWRTKLGERKSHQRQLRKCLQKWKQIPTKILKEQQSK